MTTLTAVVTARDEEQMIGECVARLAFADEVVVVVDDRTTDGTLGRAEEVGARVYLRRFTSFSDLKNASIDLAQGEWVLVLDSDERVSRDLAAEVRRAVAAGIHDAYRIPRENYFFGQRMAWGGWQEEPIRLFRRGAARYRGDIHETLEFFDPAPAIGRLRSPLAHLSHRSIHHNLAKTAEWADIQARELLRQGHPPVTWRTLAAVMGRELARRLIKRRGYRDGMPGVVESLYQPFSLFVVYVRLWELQKHTPLEERYRELESATR